MSGSLAMTSMRKPSGSLKAAALCSGDMGLGASVGFGICAQGLAADSRTKANAANLRTGREGIGEHIEISVGFASSRAALELCAPMGDASAAGLRLAPWRASSPLAG